MTIGASVRFHSTLVLFLLTVLSTAGMNLAEVIDPARLTAYNAQEIREIEEVFDSASRQGVDPELIIPRLEEGIAKGIPSSRLIPVLQRELQILDLARQLLKDHDHGSLILESVGGWQRTATLLAGGYEDSEIRAIIDIIVPRSELFRPVTALYVYLLNWGVDHARSLDLLSAIIESRIDVSEYPGIVDMLTEARRSRRYIEHVIDMMIKDLPDSGSLQELRRRVFR